MRGAAVSGGVDERRVYGEGMVEFAEEGSFVRCWLVGLALDGGVGPSCAGMDMPTTDEATKLGLTAPAFASVPFLSRSAQDFRGRFAGGGETVGGGAADGEPVVGVAPAPAASGDLFDKEVEGETGEEGDGLCVCVEVAVVGAELATALLAGDFAAGGSSATTTVCCCLRGDEDALSLRTRVGGSVWSTCAASPTTLGGGFAFGLIVNPKRVCVSGRRYDIRKSSPGLGPVCTGSVLVEALVGEEGTFDSCEVGGGVEGVDVRVVVVVGVGAVSNAGWKVVVGGARDIDIGRGV